MGIYISGVKGLPEQVQENKNKIKEVEEQIEGIDFDSIRQLQGQVAENTQDINNLEASIGVQNQAINSLNDDVDALESKTQKITYNEQSGELSIDANVNVKRINITAAQTPLTADSMVSRDDKNAISLTGANGELSLIVGRTGTQHILNFNPDGTIDIDGQPVGSKTYYNHIIKLFTSLGVTTVINIFNSDTGAFSAPSQIAKFLYDNGLRDQSAFYNCQCRLVGNKKFAKGVYATGIGPTDLMIYVQDVDTDTVQALMVTTIVEVGAVPIA